jgi:hypothetical protein
MLFGPIALLTFPGGTRSARIKLVPNEDGSAGRLRRLIAACGVESWDQRAGVLAAVLKKHPVVVSRWVGEAARIRIEDEEFAADLDTLDRGLSGKTIERLEEPRAAERQSLRSCSWHRSTPPAGRSSA